LPNDFRTVFELAMAIIRPFRARDYQWSTAMAAVDSFA
jgi:hypothetical protein